MVTRLDYLKIRELLTSLSLIQLNYNICYHVSTGIVSMATWLDYLKIRELLTSLSLIQLNI